MPALALVVATIGASWYASRASLRRALTILVAVTILVPATLTLPNGVTSLPTVHRLILVAVAVNLIRRVRSDELWFRPFFLTPLHAVLAVVTALGLVLGVALASPGVSVSASVNTLLTIVDQLAFFTVVLACIRAIDDQLFVTKVVVGVAVTSAMIGVVEHATGGSFGHWLFSRLHQETDAGRPLELRLGQPRVRAGAAFALQYAWVLAALAPLVVVSVRLVRRWWWAAAGSCLVPLAIVWSWSRSAAIFGIAVAALVTLVLVRDGRIGGAIAVLGVAALAFVTLSPVVGHGLARDADTGSIESRTRKIPVVLEFASSDPMTGLGFNSLDARGLRSTDNSFLLAYAETGAVGVAGFVVLLGAALVSTGRGLRRARGRDRLIQGACVAGVVTMICGATAFDAFSLQGSTLPFWLLVALGTSIGESTTGRWLFPSLHPIGRRAGFVVGGVALGLVVGAAWPTTASYRLQVETLPVSSVAEAHESLLLPGRRLVATVCDIATEVGPRAGAATDCRDLDPEPGLLQLRFEASSRAGAVRAAGAVLDATRQVVPDVRAQPLGPASRHRRSVATTAWAWLGLAGLAIGALAPMDGPRRRLRRPVGAR
jgi:hypothetical protein